MEIFEHISPETTQQSLDSAKQTIVAGCHAIQEILSTVIGPNGALKLLSSNMDSSSRKESIITNDGATILKNLLIDNAASQILIETSIAQDKEEGDGTTTVALLASLLVQKASLLDIHPTLIVRGFEKAISKAKEVLNELCYTANRVSLAETTLASKILKSNLSLFAGICVKAHEACPEGGVNVLKLPGALEESFFVPDGFLLENDAHVPAMRNPRVLLANTAMDYDKVKVFGSRIDVTSIKALSALEKAEKERMRVKVDTICTNHGYKAEEVGESKERAGENKGCKGTGDSKNLNESKSGKVFESNQSKSNNISKPLNPNVFCDLFINRQIMYDLPRERFKQNGVVPIDLAHFDGIERLHRVLGGSVLSSFYSPLSNSVLGTCSSVHSTEIAGKKIVVFKGIRSGAGTIVLRGSSDEVLNEAERSIHDALCVLRSSKVVPGGGCAEAVVACKLLEFAKSIDSAESSAIIAFADCLLEIVKIIATNCGLDGEDIKAKLRSLNSKNNSFYGIDIDTKDVSDMKIKGVVESFSVKKRAFVSACETAQILIKCDGFVKAKPRERSRM